MTDIFTMDGKAYAGANVLELRRNFAVLDSDLSGRVKSGRMVRDIIGTYYNYTITINTGKMTPSVRTAFYEAISAPVESHVMVFPYNDTTLSQEMYITSGEDSLRILQDGTCDWGDLSLTYTAMEPKRVP